MYFGLIYKITCLVDGKSYIGRTKQSLEERWYNHCRKNSNCVYLKHAIQKYGKDNFIIEEIARAANKEDLKILERLMITQEDTLVPKGYNLMSGGEGGTGHSEETRRKLSNRAKGRPHSGSFTPGQVPWNKGTKGLMVPWNKGKKLSEEIKQKIIATKKKQIVWNKGTKGIMKGKPNKGNFQLGNIPWNKKR